MWQTVFDYNSGNSNHFYNFLYWLVVLVAYNSCKKFLAHHLDCVHILHDIIQCS